MKAVTEIKTSPKSSKDAKTKNELLDKSKKSKESQLEENPHPPSFLEFFCRQPAFANALNFVEVHIPAKPDQAILTNVLIVANYATQEVTLTASSLMITACATFKATVQSEGEIAVPGKLLTDIISACSKTNQIKVSSGSADQSATMRSAADKPEFPDSLVLYRSLYILDDQEGFAEIRGQTGQAFPNLTDVTSKALSIPNKVVLSALNGVLFASSNDEAKQPLTAIQWLLEPEEGKLRCNATDGHQIGMVQIETGCLIKKGKAESEKRSPVQPIETLIPAKLLKELVKTLEKARLDCELKFTYDRRSNQVLFEIIHNDLQKKLIARCYSGTFPNCEALLAAYQFRESISLDRANLVDRLERINALADNKVNGVVLKFDADHQKLKLSLQRDIGQGCQSMPAIVPASAHGITIQFSIKYLKNATSALLSPSLNLMIDKPYTPGKIESQGKINIPNVEMHATYFIMPQYDQSDRTELQE